MSIQLSDEIRQLKERLALLEVWYVTNGGKLFLHPSRENDVDIVGARDSSRSASLTEYETLSLKKKDR